MVASKTMGFLTHTPSSQPRAKVSFQKMHAETLLVSQQLRFHAQYRGHSSIPGHRTDIPQAIASLKKYQKMHANSISHPLLHPLVQQYRVSTSDKNFIEVQHCLLSLSKDPQNRDSIPSITSQGYLGPSYSFHSLIIGQSFHTVKGKQRRTEVTTVNYKLALTKSIAND